MKLFSWGANSHGQLGQGNASEACCLPTEVKTSCLDPGNITSIVGGGGHTLILNRLGRVYSSGWNNKGQLGSFGKDALTFNRIQSLLSYQVSQIACGWDSSLAVTSDGSLLVWGSNSYGQLGFSKQKFSSISPPKIVMVPKVKQASLGLRHIAVVTEDGRVLVSGSGSKGQLGILDCNGRPFSELNTLTNVPKLINISSISCGQHHNIALSREGKIYVWGDNKFGQLGIDPNVQPAVYVPQELSVSTLELKGQPSVVLTGWTHTVLMSDRGELINWGRNNYGQLSSDGTERTVPWNPLLIKNVQRTKQVAVGSEHNILLTETGNILSWGWNEHGNCGTGSQENVLKPSEVRMQGRGKATMIGSGACHSFVLLDTGEI